MLAKDTKREIDHILWLRDRIRKLRSAIKNRTEFDHTTDFELLGRKLRQYEEDYFEALDGLYEALLSL